MIKNRKYISFLFVVVCMCMLLGCGGKNKGTVSGTNYYYPKEETESTQIKETVSIMAEFDSEIYMIISNDMETETMILKQMASGKQYIYYYSLTTTFLDKYGNNTSVSEFDAGRLLTIHSRDTKGRIKEAQISDAIWEYEDVVRYEIDAERGVFQIADTKYSIGENTYFVSDGKKILASDIKEDDKLRVIGMNKEILSVSVTTGHGVIELQNTEIFEGSFVQIGRKIFAEITGEMKLEVPEGTYTITVANKGYGGSKEITVERDKTLVVNLDELKGEGPKKGIISFFVVAGAEEEEIEATVKIDGKEIGYGEPILLDYGVHSIQASAWGYADFAKKLFVNSSEASITIRLEEAKEATSSVASSNKDDEASSVDGSLAGSQAGSLTGNASNKTENNSTGSSSDREASEELVSDYLSTFTELLGNVF